MAGFRTSDPGPIPFGSICTACTSALPSITSCAHLLFPKPCPVQVSPPQHFLGTTNLKYLIVDDSRPPPPEPPLPKKTILGSAGSGSSSSGDDASVPRVSSDGDSSMMSTDTPFHGISKDEANHYYAGIRHGGGGPKLIYRTSKDQFAPPLGPETSRGFVSFCPVPTDHCVSEVGVWDAIRPAVRDCSPYTVSA